MAEKAYRGPSSDAAAVVANERGLAVRGVPFPAETAELGIPEAPFPAETLELRIPGAPFSAETALVAIVA